MTTQSTSTKVLHIAALTNLLIAVYSTSALGADFSGKLKGVTITDAKEVNKPPVATFTYTVNSNIVSFNASNSSDSDGTITEYNWDFGDGSSGSGVQVQHSYSTTTNISVTLTLLDNSNGVTLTQQAITFQKPVNVAVNFQPALSVIPSGYLADTGSSFDSSAGFGWTLPPGSLGPRYYSSLNAPSEAHKSLMHVSPTGVWEYVVANGSYQVTVVVGDPNPSTNIQSVQVEGTALITNEPLSSTNMWIERTNTVRVDDGKLTLSFTGKSGPTKLCFVIIKGA